jgi:hypothetical protein
MESLTLLNSDSLLAVYLLANAAVVIALGVMHVLIGDDTSSLSPSARGRAPDVQRPGARRPPFVGATPAWLAATRAHPAGRWLVVVGVLALPTALAAGHFLAQS